MNSDSARPTASRPGKDPLKRPRKAAKSGGWPRPCVGRDLMQCRRPFAQSEAYVCPNGDVWHLFCVRRDIRNVREAFQGEDSPLARAVYRQRVREHRAYFGMGGFADVPEVISDDEQ